MIAQTSYDVNIYVAMMPSSTQTQQGPEQIDTHFKLIMGLAKKTLLFASW